MVARNKWNRKGKEKWLGLQRMVRQLREHQVQNNYTIGAVISRRIERVKNYCVTNKREDFFSIRNSILDFQVISRKINENKYEKHTDVQTLV